MAVILISGTFSGFFSSHITQAATPGAIYEALLAAPVPRTGVPVNGLVPVTVASIAPFADDPAGLIGAIDLRDQSSAVTSMVSFVVFTSDDAALSYLHAIEQVTMADVVGSEECSEGAFSNSSGRSYCLMAQGTVAIIGQAVADPLPDPELASAFSAFASTHLIRVIDALDMKTAQDAANDPLNPGVQLLAALRGASFPAEQLAGAPDHVDSTPWTDMGDSDLEGSLGGLLISDGDPFSEDMQMYLAYIVYGDMAATDAAWDRFLEMPTSQIESLDLPAADEALFVGSDGFFTILARSGDVIMIAPSTNLAGESDLTSATQNANAGLAHLETVRHLLPTASPEASTVP